MSFDLHPDLKRDGVHMGDFPLCHVRLINDANYPWFVLIPKRENISDTIDLMPKDHRVMWEESRIFSAAIMNIFAGDKLNVAALGNMTPQLHLHHIVRFVVDPAWPGPIWGKRPMTPYDAVEIMAIYARLEAADMKNYTPMS